MTERSGCDHGPWVDIHAHPGCGFLGGLPRDSPLVQSLGGDRSVEQIGSAAAGEVSVVNASTVADLAVIGPTASGGLRAAREFEPGEASGSPSDALRRVELVNLAEPRVGG